MAWVLTLPASIGLSACLFWMYNRRITKQCAVQTHISRRGGVWDTQVAFALFYHPTLWDLSNVPPADLEQQWARHSQH